MSLNERVAALPRALTLSPLCPHHLTLVVHIGNVVFVPGIGIGGSLAAPPLPHHLAYGSVPRRFEKLR
jgi:hypothetical protein